jgi:hypothetical protein
MSKHPGDKKGCGGNTTSQSQYSMPGEKIQLAEKIRGSPPSPTASPGEKNAGVKKERIPYFM